MGKALGRHVPSMTMTARRATTVCVCVCVCEHTHTHSACLQCLSASLAVVPRHANPQTNSNSLERNPERSLDRGSLTAWPLSLHCVPPQPLL